MPFQSLDDPAQIEEERRLMYVALTRAKENLFILKPNLENSGSNFYRYQGMALTNISRFLESDKIIENHTNQIAIQEERPKFQFNEKPYFSNHSSAYTKSNSDEDFFNSTTKRYNF